MAEFRSENVEIVGGDLVIKDASGTERVRIEGTTGSVTVRSADGTPMVVLTETGSVQAGGPGQDGDLELFASGGSKTVHVGADQPQLLFEHPDDAGRTIELDGRNATLSLGGTGHDGTIAMHAATGDKTVHVGSLRPQLLLRHPETEVETVKLDGHEGELSLRHPSNGTTLAKLDGGSGDLTLGGVGNPGDLYVQSSADVRTVEIGGNHGQVLLNAPSDGSARVQLDGENANITLGGPGADGDLYLRSSTDVRSVELNGNQARILLTNPDDGVETVHLDGINSNITLGGAGHDGDLYLQSAADVRGVELNGNQARMVLTNPDDGVETVHVDGINGNITLGGSGHDGDLFVHDSSGDRTIHISGESGDIILENADCAEDFDLANPGAGEPGTVLVLGDDAALRECADAYDRRVVGVVSGAGSHRPGIVLDRRASTSATVRAPVALMGKVYCKADAEHAPIRPGDLLTTSPTLGHAMKADTGNGAVGTVLGKALAPLNAGCGLIPILVTLQ